MKSRFTCLDVHAACTELASQYSCSLFFTFNYFSIVGSRLQNIYDINSKTFLFKLQKKEEEKLKVVIESGTRLHKTSYDFESSNIQPSFFAMKLRKWLRDRRITAFHQVGFDRVVHFEFGHVNPTAVIHLYVEFYSAGNIILTDSEGTVLLILRVVTNSQGEPILKLGSTYGPPAGTTLHQQFERLKQLVSVETTPQALKKMLKDQFSTFSTQMVSHLVATSETTNVLKAISDFEEAILKHIGSGKGFITVEDLKNEEQIFVDFLCFPFSTLASKPQIETSSFNDACDEFFSKIEQQKAQKALTNQEKEAQAKIEAIRHEQQNRIHGLDVLIGDYLKKAQLIELYSKEVGDVLLVVSAALDAGMDWTNLDFVIADEQRKGNPTAMLIRKLKLDKGIVTIALADEACIIETDIVVSKTPHANSTRYYELRKAAIEKAERTRKHFEKALKSAEAKIRSDLKSHQTKAKRQQIFSKRKTLWFEKFSWFISSDNFLVISGRDMQQNELLVKRYLKEGDVYVHADIHGASSVIVKNRRMDNGQRPLLTIPPRTLSEAGQMSLCNSKAWDSKIVTSAWWVYASQVSKTAPSGEYLPTGSFMIRGKKNFLPPSQLLYGFGFMFVLDEEGKEKQKQERLLKDEQFALEEQPVLEDLDKYMEMLDIKQDETAVVSVTAAPKAKKQQPKQQSKKLEQEAKEAGVKSNRGSKGKQKKIAKKYADQDEEERDLRMKLLASQKKVNVVEEKKAVVQEKKPIVPRSQPQLEAEVEEQEEKIGEDELAVVDSLCSNLKHKFGHLQYAIPVAGPMSALSNYTFRVKLVPGSMKRGKAAQQALHILTTDSRDLDVRCWAARSDEEADEQEASVMYRRVKELIRAVPDSDLNLTMLGNVKIMASAKEIVKSKKTMAQAKGKKAK